MDLLHLTGGSTIISQEEVLREDHRVDMVAIERAIYKNTYRADNAT